MEIEEEQYADLREGLGTRHAAPQSGILCNFDGGARSNTRRLMGVIAVVSAFSLLSFSLSVAALVKANDTSPAAAPSHSDKAKNDPNANNAPAPTAANAHHTRTADSDDQSTVTSITGAMFAECTSKSNFLFGDAVHDGPGGKHHYQVVGGTWAKLTWQDAEKDAFGRCYNGLRGHLVEVNDAAENQLLVGLMRDHRGFSPGNTAWVGAAALRNPNKFEWIEGRSAGKIFYDATAGDGGGTVLDNAYTNWDTDQPGADGSENCVAMSGTGAWDDTSCYKSLEFFFVEFDG